MDLINKRIDLSATFLQLKGKQIDDETDIPMKDYKKLWRFFDEGLRIQEIDFTSFTIEDLDGFMSELYGYRTSDDLTSEEEANYQEANKGNSIQEQIFCSHFFSGIKRSPKNRSSSLDDVFI